MDSATMGKASLWARMTRILPGPAWALLILLIVFHFVAQIHFKDIFGEKFTYDPILRLYLPIAMAIAILFVWSAKLKSYSLRGRIIAPPLLLEISLALGTVFYIICCDPILFVDDAGFILRYLDNFQEGCFYCYNVEDGAVFGISSFIYGILAGALNWLHIMDAVESIYFLVYLGTFFTFFLLFRILHVLVKNPGIVFLLWLFILSGNLSVLKIFNSGMESPVHLAVILGAFYFYVRGNWRYMWLFLALSVISKLDTVPLVLVVGLFWLLENWRELLKISWKNPLYRDLVIFGILPIFLWIGFSTMVFGSPLPQSAYAKVNYHGHAKGSWFPFLRHFTISPYRAPLFYAFLALYPIHLIGSLLRGKGIRQLVFGLSFIATMVLYFFYNPGERMSWYYILPETLMLIQVALSIQWIFAGMKPTLRMFGIGFVLCIAFVLTWSRMMNEVDYFRGRVNTVEKERLRIGQWLGTVGGENDTLMGGHGLNMWPWPGYSMDATGLNSALVTSFNRDTELIRKKFRPHYIVTHGYMWIIHSQINKLNYQLDSSFYDVTKHNSEPWRIFRRVAPGEKAWTMHHLKKSDIQGTEIDYLKEKRFVRARARSFQFPIKAVNPRDQFLSMGIFRQETPFEIKVIDRFPGDSVAYSMNVTIPAKGERGIPQSHDLRIPLDRGPLPDSLPPGPRIIELEFKGAKKKVVAVSFAILREKE